MVLMVLYANTGNGTDNGVDLSTTGASCTTNNIIVNVALDLDNGQCFMSLNSIHRYRSDCYCNEIKPQEIRYKLLYGNLQIMLVVQILRLNWHWNFGNPPFAITTGNADANGYGNFEHAVPSGYYALMH
jgi:hypothetical protein